MWIIKLYEKVWIVVINQLYVKYAKINNLDKIYYYYYYYYYCTIMHIDDFALTLKASNAKLNLNYFPLMVYT